MRAIAFALLFMAIVNGKLNAYVDAKTQRGAEALAWVGIMCLLTAIVCAVGGL